MMHQKAFVERLQQTLDSIDFPIKHDERVEAFAKLVKIPKFKAEMLLSGHTQPEPALLQIIADELEVSSEWLTGQSEEEK